MLPLVSSFVLQTCHFEVTASDTDSSDGLGGDDCSDGYYDTRNGVDGDFHF